MKKLKIDNSKYKDMVMSICRDIAKDNWRPDYIVGIVRGGLLPALMISQYFNIKMYSLKVSLRDSVSEDCEVNCWMSEDAFNGKNILIVDDINDTGATLNWIIRDWQSSSLPDSPEWENKWTNNIRFAVTVDNLASKCDVKMNYVGLEINKAEDDVWIEFPYEEWWAK